MPDAMVRLQMDGPMAIITLNRPDKLNALNREMLGLIGAACDRVEQDQAVRVVVITGAGERAFSAGADINEWSALSALDMWRVWIPEGHRVFERVARLRQPVLAALNGFAFGGGLELAIAADLRLAADEAELAFPECGIGIVPGWGSTQRLPSLIGPARAKQMVFTGERVSAHVAEHWGLVNEVLPRAALMERTLRLAHAIADRAPLAVQMAKQTIDGHDSASAARTLEALAGALTAGTEDACEGAAAFRDRRAARFQGR